MTAQRTPSNAFARTSISGLTSCFSSDLRRFPKRGPNHIPLVMSCVVRFIHLPSIHEPSFDPPFKPISLASTNAQLIKPIETLMTAYAKLDITVFTGSARPQAEQHSQDADGSCATNEIPGDDHFGYVVSRDSVTE